MKSWHFKTIAVIFLCVAGIVISWMGYSYFQEISKNIYDDSTGHLNEVYSQVNNKFNQFIERNWGNLNDWDYTLYAENDDDVSAFLNSRREDWGFSEFYFMSEGGYYRTLSGKEGKFNLSDRDNEDLFLKNENEKERIMAGVTMLKGESATIFAIPVSGKQWRGFEYSAIAITYTNQDMVDSLKVKAFSEQSECYVVDIDGNNLLSTMSGGSAYGNYVTFLKLQEDISRKSLEDIDRMQEDWKNGDPGVIVCNISGVANYISYQNIGYRDYIMLGIVPESVAGAGLLKIQRVTIDVLGRISVIVVVSVILCLIYGYRKKAQKNVLEVQYREMMFDTLSVNVNDIFLMLDGRTLRVDYLSPNVERLLGVPHDAALKNIRLLAGDNMDESKESITIKDFDDIPIHGSRQWEREHTHRGTGELRWYKESIYHENIFGLEKFLIVMSDRTQERMMNKNLQEALETAKRANKAKSHFLSNMSHDIRTPMNAIIGFSVLLAKDADKPDKVREYTRKISSSGHHLLSLINDVLDMSKIESGKTSLNIAKFSLPELTDELQAIIAPQAKAKNQIFEINIEGRPAEHMMGDKLHLNQILINLLSNAVKYTQEGGHIEFTIKELPQMSPQHAAVRFEVKDNGMGMSSEFLKTVFEPFVRASDSTVSKIQGTGLGMAITKNLVDLMGGVIGVESVEGEGSVFTVDLSFALSAREEDEDFWKNRGISKILLADDDMSICSNIKYIMEETGVDVYYVNDGLSAVEYAARECDKNEPFHVILIDWKMPGMSGVETVRMLRGMVSEKIPILVLTSYDWSDIEEEARAAGVDAFIPKPFFISTLRQALASLTSVSARPEMPEEEDYGLDGMMFLVAEDNELNAEILSEMLAMENARCELAVNGSEAFDMFSRSEADHYDMILMDVQMPVMNGYEATRAIRACGHVRAKTIPIVAMTANAFAEDVRDAMQAGMNEHLAKPIDMKKMKTLIGKLRSLNGVAGEKSD